MEPKDRKALYDESSRESIDREQRREVEDNFPRFVKTQGPRSNGRVCSVRGGVVTLRRIGKPSKDQRQKHAHGSIKNDDCTIASKSRRGALSERLAYNASEIGRASC